VEEAEREREREGASASSSSEKREFAASSKEGTGDAQEEEGSAVRRARSAASTSVAGRRERRAERRGVAGASVPEGRGEEEHASFPEEVRTGSGELQDGCGGMTAKELLWFMRSCVRLPHDARRAEHKY